MCCRIGMRFGMERNSPSPSAGVETEHTRLHGAKQKAPNKERLCFGTNSNESAVPPKLIPPSGSSQRIRSYAAADNGAASRQALLPNRFRPALRSPFTRRPYRHSTLSGSLGSALCALLLFVLGFDGSIIAQSVSLVKSFLQLFRWQLAFFGTVVLKVAGSLHMDSHPITGTKKGG